MLGSNLESTYVFLRTFYGGIAMGFSYDLLVKILFKPFTSKLAGEIFFGICAFFISLSVLFGVTQLYIRWYMFFGFGCGWLFYLAFISKAFVDIAERIENIGFGVVKMVCYPVKKVTDRVILRNKDKISKFNLMISRIKNIPNKCKTSYNKYMKYIRKKVNENGKGKKA